MAALCAATAQAGPASPASPAFVERYRLEQHGGGLGVEVDESVVFLVREVPDKGPQWVVERQRRDRNWCGRKSADGQCVATDVTVHDWASSSARTCAFLYVYMAGFADFRQTARDQPPVIVTDSPLITLAFAPSAAAGKPPPVLSEYVGPLALWWREMENGLKPCWTTTPPVIDGVTLETRLAKPTS